MTLLTRYILRQNCWFLLLVCGVGLGVYIFIDLFDRLDDFLEARVAATSIVAYFLYRIPSILAQIFPAVFLLALLAQLGLMLRGRELLALDACAVSPTSIIRPVLCYAVILCLFQLFFSEVLGVPGHHAADKIWAEEVRERTLASRQLSDVWFREKNRIVRMGTLMPMAGTGQNLMMYVLDPADSGQIMEIVRSDSFRAEPGNWELAGARSIAPDTFAMRDISGTRLDLATDVRGFLVIDPKTKLESLPLWQLGREISRLRDSGSNIERLRTAWHMKLAYAGSVLVMALIALAAVTLSGSLLVLVPAGLVATFCYYGLFMLCISAGEKGLLPPPLAAWTASVIFSTLAGGRLLWGKSFHLG